MRVADEIVRVRRAVRHALRRRAAGRPAFPRGGRERSARPGCSSRSRPTASASTRPSPSGSRACRSARCRSASTATREAVYAPPAPRRLAREGARGLPRRTRSRLAARDHVRADAHQPARGRRGDRARPFARRLPVQHRPAHAHRHRRAPVGSARARRRSRVRRIRRLLERAVAPFAGGWSSATSRSTSRRPAREPREPAGHAARPAQRLGESLGGAAARLRRSAPRWPRQTPGTPTANAWQSATSGFGSAPRRSKTMRRSQMRMAGGRSTGPPDRDLTEDHERHRNSRRSSPEGHAASPRPSGPAPADKPPWETPEDRGRLRAGHGAALHPLHLRFVAAHVPGRAVEEYRAPLFLAWQLTNRCRARCLACCEESGPDKAWRDELESRRGAATSRDASSIAASPTSPSAAASPSASPHSWEIFERARGRRRRPQDRDRRQPHRRRVRPTASPASASSACRSRSTARARRPTSACGPGSSFAAATAAIRRLVARGLTPQLVFVPTRSTCAEIVRPTTSRSSSAAARS